MNKHLAVMTIFLSVCSSVWPQTANHEVADNSLASILPDTVITNRPDGREVIYSGNTKATFYVSDTHSFYNMLYEIQATEKTASYYEIIVTDFAGNVTRKKLTSQYSLLTWFHTSIDRSSYNK